MGKSSKREDKDLFCVGQVDIGMHDLMVAVLPAKLAPLWTADSDLPEVMKWVDLLTAFPATEPVVQFVSPWCLIDAYFLLNGNVDGVDRLSALVSSIPLINREYPNLSVGGPAFMADPATFPDLYKSEPLNLTVAQSREVIGGLWEVVDRIREFKGEGKVKNLGSHAKWTGTGYTVLLPSMKFKNNHHL